MFSLHFPPLWYIIRKKTCIGGMTTELNNAKRERFCREYLIDLNGAAAAVRAGYAEKSAAQQACRLLRNDNIQRRIAELAQEVKSRSSADAAEVMEYLTKIMRGEIDVKGGQVRAAELLAKRFGLLNEKLTISAAARCIIIDDI